VESLPEVEVVPLISAGADQPADPPAPWTNATRKSGRRGRRGRADARRVGLAATYASFAAHVDLSGAGTIEAPAGMANGTEPTVVPTRAPESPPRQPQAKIVPAVPAASAVLDERIVKEINRRKTSFRLCYESARRRGVTVTRADVKWILESDGNVRDVQVEVAEDEYLATCLGVVASQPFPTGIGQEVPVAIPLLFLIAR
jgi:hypothetical protein